MSTGKPKKPLLHRLIGWPSLVIGAAALALSTVLQDWMLALIGGSVVVLSIAELIATASGRR
jgi:zinc transporter ZupT